MIRTLLPALLLIYNCSVPARAQIGKWLKVANDTAYISDFTGDLAVRLYGSNKFVSYTLQDRKLGESLTYRPNSPLNLGFGANYKFVGLNIGLNFPFINKTDRYGKSKFLDLQTHLYLRKIVGDFYIQYYKGQYLARQAPPLWNRSSLMPAYIRPDVYTMNFGFSMQYIFNNTRFSFRAAYLQNERQKRSAGSFMTGVDVHTLFIRGDSSIIPAGSLEQTFFGGGGFDRSAVYNFTLNAGYGYTLVLLKQFFATVSAHAGPGLNYSRLDHPDHAPLEGLGLQLNTTVRIAAGYHSDRYFAGIHYAGVFMHSNAPMPQTAEQFRAGNFRFSLTRRFGLRKPLF